MPSRSYYLRQAELLRSMVATAGDEDLRQQYLRRANEYVILAMSLPEDGYISPAAPSPKEEQPAAAQQQQQVQPDISENKE
jgi:hypothetical protein